MHSAEFKAKVLEECRRSGASVAAVAQANGLNANLVRKWLDGQGLKRCGLAGGVGAGKRALVPAGPEPGLRFVPVDLDASLLSGERGRSNGSAASQETVHIHVQLRRGGTSLDVRWPASQAWECAAWLGELAAKVLK